MLVPSLQPGALGGQSPGPPHWTHWPSQKGVPASSAAHCSSVVQPTQLSDSQVVPIPASTHSASVTHWTQTPSVLSQ